MKKLHLLFLALIVICTSCNDEWTEEQFVNLVSFKAPLTDEGVSNVYVRYKENETTSFDQPLIVSGSTLNSNNISVKVAVDRDTLDVLNYEQFQNREEFYYQELTSEYFSIPSTVQINSGEDTGLLRIDFSLNNIDMVEKWLLPLTIMEDPAANYTPNPRKHYRKALLRIYPFNDYSGVYSGTALKTTIEGYENETPIVKAEIRTYVVDENTIFFYAGNIDEDRIDRENYKIYATFNETGGISLTTNNPAINLNVNKEPSYTISEQFDVLRPYLLHRYITINNIDYDFTDYTMVPNIDINYKVSGTLITERQINTQIPDEDQAIEW